MYQGLTHGGASAILATGPTRKKIRICRNRCPANGPATMNLTERPTATRSWSDATKQPHKKYGSYKINPAKKSLSRIRRTRHGGQHHPLGAGQNRRRPKASRACRCSSPQVHGQRKDRLPWGPQRSFRRFHRGKDGHPRHSTCVMNYDVLSDTCWVDETQRHGAPCSP